MKNLLSLLPFIKTIQKMKNLTLLMLLYCFFSCKDAAIQDKLTALETELSETKNQLAAATNVTCEPGLIHSVFFWLKEDLSETDRTAFLEGCRSLTKISTIKNCYIGPPAATAERGVVDNSYSYALIVHFNDLEGQNAYQIDPIHLKFVEDHKDKWTKVIVYDNILGE